VIESMIPNFEAEAAFLDHLAPSGYTLAFNVGFQGAELFRSSFPQKWQERYESRAYYFTDPVLIWSITKVGRKRWSELKLPDVRGIFAEAKEFGLSYGVVISTNIGGSKSVLTAARDDREFSDEELDLLQAKLEYMAGCASPKGGLSDGELAVFRELANGASIQETAETLGISKAAVNKRIDKAKQKLHAKSTMQAVSIAASKNYI